MHDDAEFGPEPDKFKPERFLGGGLRDPANTGAFGYGRRLVLEDSVTCEIMLISFDVLEFVQDVSSPRMKYSSQ